jgi:hypothetical protein
MGMDASPSQPYMHRHTGISPIMRLLLYFLALLTGLSAAEAARPVEAASPTSASLQLDFAEAVATNAAIDRARSPAGNDERPLFKTEHFVPVVSTVRPSTPVSRADSARE